MIGSTITCEDNSDGAYPCDQSTMNAYEDITLFGDMHQVINQ